MTLITPLTLTYDQKLLDTDPMRLRSTRIGTGRMEQRLSFSLIIEPGVKVSFEFSCSETVRRQVPATPAEMRFARKMRKLIEELEAGVVDD